MELDMHTKFVCGVVFFAVEMIVLNACSNVPETVSDAINEAEVAPEDSLASVDSTQDSVEQNKYVNVLSKGETLKSLSCDSAKAGEFAYVYDSAEVYLCNGKEWFSLKGDVGPEGKAGENGADGKSVEGKAGDKGPQGPAGLDGKGCVVASDSSGVVTIKCGDGEKATSTNLYKAMCGTNPYDPAEENCCGEKIFNADSQFCDRRDNQLYNIAKIGSYVWMTENLNYKYSIGTIRTYCYDDVVEYCEKYGRLYTWAAAADSAALFSKDCQGCGDFATEEERVKIPSSIQGVCPDGWHLATNDEWEDAAASDKATDEKEYGYVLKSSFGWADHGDKSGNGSDAYGMTVLPAGTRKDAENYSNNGALAKYWSTVEYSSSTIIAVTFSNANDYIGMRTISFAYAKSNAISVRCVQNYASTEEE